MASEYVGKKEEAQAVPDVKIRLTITARNAKEVEKLSTKLLERAKAGNVKTKGPVRMPTKVLHITTRKTPNGEGSKTWDRYEMRIHKRLIDFKTQPQTVQQIASFDIPPGVRVEVAYIE